MHELLRYPSRLRGYDAILWGGGQMLQDNGSILKNPYWATVLAAARRITRAPIIGCGLGIGPVDTAWGRYFARRALRGLEALVVRDATSAQLASQLIGSRGPAIQQAPDPATALAMADEHAGERYLQEKEGVPMADHEIRVGIAVRRWNTDRRRVRPVQWLYAPPSVEGEDPLAPGPAHLAEALNRFSANRKVRILFFPLYCASWEGDDRVSTSLATQLKAPAHVLRLNAEPGVVKAAMGRCDLFVSFRLHGAVLSMGAGVPSVGVSYADKVESFFAGHAHTHRCLTLKELCAPDGGDRLSSVLEDTWARRQEIRSALLKSNQRMKQECDQYGHVIQQALLKRKARPA